MVSCPSSPIIDNNNNREDCFSPFGHGDAERSRLALCNTVIVLASYDAGVHFARQVLSLVNENDDDFDQDLTNGFKFYVQTEHGNCYDGNVNVSGLLCDLVQCSAARAGAVGDMILHQVMRMPEASLDYTALIYEQLGYTCGAAYSVSQTCLPGQVNGGSGGGSGVQVYCTNNKTVEGAADENNSNSIQLLDAGGGGGGVRSIDMQRRDFCCVRGLPPDVLVFLKCTSNFFIFHGHAIGS